MLYPWLQSRKEETKVAGISGLLVVLPTDDQRNTIFNPFQFSCSLSNTRSAILFVGLHLRTWGGGGGERITVKQLEVHLSTVHFFYIPQWFEAPGVT